MISHNRGEFMGNRGRKRTKGKGKKSQAKMAANIDQSEAGLINLRPITTFEMNLRPMRGWANKPPTINLDWSGALYSPFFYSPSPFTDSLSFYSLLFAKTLKIWSGDVLKHMA